MAKARALAFVLAGGKGERLFPLTAMRSKPSVPFGSRYRIVDFVLSNLVNSHVYSIYLLVQYKSQSLIEHVRKHWVLSNIIPHHFIAVVPPQMRMGPEWFQGTSDAVAQNVNLIRQQDPDYVIIFGADHIYRMDIRQMLRFHEESGAHVSVSARPVPSSEASSFGVIAVDDAGRITDFQEKPKTPAHIPGQPGRSLVSMGNYIFNTDVLLNCLMKAQKKKWDDFGKDILPDLVATGKLYAYNFETNIIPGTKPFEERGYWRDVGSIRSFYDAHMDMLGEEPLFDPNNNQWPIQTGGQESSSARIIKGDIRNCLLGMGVTIGNAKIRGSILRNNVIVEDKAVVEDSIIMDGCIIRKGARIKGVIADKNNIVEAGEVIGMEAEKDRFHCHIDRHSGIAILPKEGRKKKPFEI